MADISTSAAKPPGKASLIVTIGALTVLGVGGGGLVGKLIVMRFQGATQAATETQKTALPYGGDIEVHELPAMVTNLAAPSETRVRLQVSIVFARKAVENPAILMAEVGDDLVAYMKTVTLKNLEGASGIQNLRADLNDRASVRSQGKVREVIIETLVLQ